ncbi:unnamed protein product [Calypogeia fissa]
MHNGSRGPVVLQVPVVVVLFFSTFGASSMVGSNVAAAIPTLGSPGCYQDDRCTLLTFKKGLLKEGEPALASWNNADVTQWQGVTWGTAADGTYYAEKLELGEFNLNGTSIAPLLQSGLTNLTTLNISGNSFSATLPDPLRICPALLVLDLSNNSFVGNFPQVLGCDDATNSSSSLNPVISPSINLQVLNLSLNKFSGEVESSLFSSGGGGGSFSSLKSLVLEQNSFSGSFPSSIGNCTNLVELKLSYNNFSGTIPFDTLQNLQNFEILEAMSNSFTGELQIPNGAGSFGQLKSLILNYNFLSGNIPESVGNLSNLVGLELKYNNLTGSIPKTLAKLTNLKILSLQYNQLNGTIPEELSQLRNLATLSLNDNKLKGTLSPFLSNCTNLRSIWLGQNSLSGGIPREWGSLPNLVVLSLYGNFFNQSIPSELGRVSTLVGFDLSYNNLVGAIPDELCELLQLQVLLLNNNQLTGLIPNCFGNYTYIRLLDLSVNVLTGYLPSDLSNMSMNLQSLSKAPAELSSASYIQELNGQNLVFQFSQSPISYSFFSNFLIGQIPSSLGNVQTMQQLRLNNNSLSGAIPEALGNASALFMLDLSYNDLSGVIPYSLTALHFLSTVNFSYNNLSGEIPQASQFLTFTKSSFSGNPYLCGFPLDLKCSTLGASPFGSEESNGPSMAKKLLPLYITLGSAFICVCFLGGLFAWSWIRGCSRRNSSLVSNDGDIYENKEDTQFFQVTISSVLPSLSPKELALATENYNENNIIGDGGFGLVYKAVLSCGSVVAVKKLLEDGAQGQNEFLAEMRTLGKIKHKNLVALLGYCAYGKERILVYEYMKNGSLDTWLHCRDDGMASLDWRTRLKVARGAAEGLAFLHHGSDPTIIHRDIKASNILLDGNFEARLADFGLARSTRAFESHVSTDFAGTAGYIPPEYSQATASTTKGDVYSFGVVLLEILTGRRPTDPFFRKNEMSHVATWILDISMEEALENTLDMTSAASTDEMLELMRIACLCCQDVPSKRPNMGQVVRMLDALERQQSPSRSPSVVLYDEAMSSPRCR